MESWKQQLTDISRSEATGDPDSSDPEWSGGDPDGSPRVLRAKQAQAWRSVGALQLRVEQLTLEVTKVGRMNDMLVFFQSFAATKPLVLFVFSFWRSATPFS